MSLRSNGSPGRKFIVTGKGGVLKKGLYGKAPPRGPAPYPFVYHLIMTEKVPLLHT